MTVYRPKRLLLICALSNVCGVELAAKKGIDLCKALALGALIATLSLECATTTTSAFHAISVRKWHVKASGCQDSATEAQPAQSLLVTQVRVQTSDHQRSSSWISSRSVAT